MRITLGLLVVWAVSAQTSVSEPVDSSNVVSGFNEDVAKEVLNLSAVSYCDSDTILNWSCKPCASLPGCTLFNLVVGLTPDGIETKVVFMVCEGKKWIVISFEGTHDPKQLLNEITQFNGVDYDIHPIPDATVMKYFYNTYKSTLMDPVRENLATLMEGPYKGYKVVFCGHSLGGALA